MDRTNSNGSRWKHEVVGDLGLIHSSLQQVLSKFSLPALPPLKATTADDSDPVQQYDAADREEEVPSCDNSPRSSPKGDALPHAPIESLYQLTGLRALRSDDPTEERKPTSDFASNHPVHDFISRGIVGVEDAERLFSFFLNRIDHFMYRIGSHKYRDLDSLRRGSAVLTVTICTVAALHDPHSNHLYKACSREFRRLVSASMFDRRIDHDRMRALCVASYWLHDNWMISGYAIRRAMEINLSSSYQRVLATGDENSMECIRLWYVLYICDRHLSILYGRPSIVRDELSITGWEALMRTPAFTEADKRLVSQMALLIIMGNARELFGPDTGEAIPKAFAPQLTSFSRQIDHWMGFWSTELLSKTHSLFTDFVDYGADLSRNPSIYRRIPNKRRDHTSPPCKAPSPLPRLPRPSWCSCATSLPRERGRCSVSCHGHNRDGPDRLRYTRRIGRYPALHPLHDCIRMRLLVEHCVAI